MVSTNSEAELDPSSYPITRKTLQKPYKTDQDISSEPLPTNGSNVRFHVMSYNILADQLARCELHPGVSPSILDFKFRAPRIIQDIEQSDASLICLQEVDHIDDFYDNRLKSLGFEMVYGRRKPSPSDAQIEHHTIAIGYKPEVWTLVNSELVDLAEVKHWFDGPNQADYTCGNNFNAMFCTMLHKESLKKIVLANTHLEHDYIMEEPHVEVSS